MNIILFLKERCLTFKLPNQISGSYSFDEDIDEEDKLINVESENNKWILYSTELVHIMNDKTIINSIEITPNNFYVINRNNINYLIYAFNSESIDVLTYNYDENSNIVIGNKDTSIIYNLPFLNDIKLSIKKSSNNAVVNVSDNTFCYINNINARPSDNIINYGDTITFYGIKIIVMNNFLTFIIPKGMVAITNTSGITPLNYNLPEIKDITVKDIELYNKNNYFAKSPRIRRHIEEKEIPLDSPPKLKSEEKTPFLLTIGPMISLMTSSGITLLSTIMRINEGTTTAKDSWPSFATCGAMIVTSLLWPMVTRSYNRKLDKKNNEEVKEKYRIYLEEKDKEFKREYDLQKTILEENLLNTTECYNIIKSNNKNNFWVKRKEQIDFLEVRVGIGQVPLRVKVNLPKEGFTLEEDELKKLAEEVVNKNNMLNGVPIGYSLYDNYFTDIMGPSELSIPFTNNLILQLMTFYCYDELKFIVFTNDKNKNNWEYLKYCNYTFNNHKQVRYFATNNEEYKALSEYLEQELNYRINSSKNKDTGKEFDNYYIIICDDYREAKKTEFFKKLVEVDKNIGYSCLFIENTMSNLPSKCSNFISLNNGQSSIMKNSFENSQMISFRNEIINNIDMKEISKIVSNIPLEIKDEQGELPNAIGFLEMEKVGKVEQLNILNRWNTNDSVKTLKAEIGVNSDNELMYLDLHEKFHGPHGLIAGMTGSGKSEFIITYILSMCMNYSPDDISFVLIDYKGGGLAGAFQNEVTGIKLPHLAGTITNLDKSEMNRTLVSIDSEIKRRQSLFNTARDNLKESTIDIYKYQQAFHDGKLPESIPHLFIICDEFAELKSQQPDFMDNLISIARIGRSLGVHLILATQKPSGVVNDQIWSNTKFRVCLKVQDAGDSNEMLKKPDAANIKQTGRFYLQVGYDEYYELGQSAWCGKPYYPSDKPIKIVDKSLNFINSLGIDIKKIEEENTKKQESQGEEITSILKEIINVSNETNKKVKTLWLPSINGIILVDNLAKKYNIAINKYDVSAIIGEYDAPESQKQDIINYNFVKNGNLAIYGMDGTDKDKILQTIVYSVCNNYSVDEVNIYAIDYGSESLRMYNPLPHFGGIVCNGDEEKYTNLINLIKDEVNKRKELFMNYGGEYLNYIKNSNDKLPLKLILINNLDTVKASIATFNDDMIELTRDSNRYGIVFVVTANNSNSLGSKVAQNFPETLCLKLKDLYDYTALLGAKVKNEPKEIVGRGVCQTDGIAHEYQTASLVEDENTLNDFLTTFINNTKNKYPHMKAKKIPSLPLHVKMEDISDSIKDYTNFPVGIYKDDLNTATFNYMDNIGNLILSNKMDNMIPFIKSMLDTIKTIPNNNIIFIDSTENYKDNPNIKTYCNSHYEEFINNLYTQLNNNINGNFGSTIIMFNGINRISSKIDDKKLLEKLFNLIKKMEKIPVIVFDEGLKLKQVYLESWYRTIFNGQVGLWIGSGLTEQSVLKVSSYNKEYRASYKCDMGFVVSNGSAKLARLLDYYEEGADKE